MRLPTVLCAEGREGTAVLPSAQRFAVRMCSQDSVDDTLVSLEGTGLFILRDNVIPAAVIGYCQRLLNLLYSLDCLLSECLLYPWHSLD